jgi:hypothetical protein
MSTIFFDSRKQDERRRRELYQGDLFVFSPTRGSVRLVELARELAEEAFAPHHPPEAQFHLPAERYVEILAVLKPKFIHHPLCKELIRTIFSELGCDLPKTYFDVPRLRTMTHGDYLSAGLAYAFHAHRDTWFSAPPSQLNWWIPVYDIQSENTMAFHPRYWSQPVPNSSSEYNYYKWNQESRRAAAQQIKTETRKQPRAVEPMDPEPEIRIVCEVGGIIIFSGAQMHSTVRNTSGQTRFSIDFRSVHLDDVMAKAGAPNVDSECTGTTLRDYLRGSDFVRLQDEIAMQYDGDQPLEGELIYDPSASRVS